MDFNEKLRTADEAVTAITKITADFDEAQFFATIATAIDDWRALHDMSAEEGANNLRLMAGLMDNIENYCSKITPEDVHERIDKVCIKRM